MATTPPTQLVRYSPTIDTYHRHLADNPTPQKLANALRSVESGDVAALVELSEEFEARHAHLRSVATTRRNALTGLPWKVEPDERAKDQGAAKTAADYIDERLRGMDSWETTLEHLATGIGPNIAVTELVWDNAELLRTVDVPGHRLLGHFWNSKEIRIETDENQVWGVSTFPGKFVVHHPQTRAGMPLRSTIVHAITLPWLVANLSAKDWLSFSEIYGIPWRWVEYTDSVVDADRDTIQDMLEQMSSDLAATLPAGASVKTFQASGTGETYERQMAWAENAMSKAYLGQTLTTDIGDVGSRAAATVHNEVRKDLLFADISSERRTVSQQVIRPMLKLKFPGKEMPMPRWIREVPERRDIEAERLDLDQLRFAAENGVRLDKQIIYERLRLPEPITPEPKTSTAKVSATVNELTLGVERAVRAGDLALANALREKIAEALGVTLPPLTELPKTSENSSGNGIDKEDESANDSTQAE